MWEQFQRGVDDEFQSSGTCDKLVQQVREELNQSSWADDVQAKLEGRLNAEGLKASELTEETMTRLCDALRDDCRRIVPNNIKQSLLSSVSNFVDTQVADLKQNVLKD